MITFSRSLIRLLYLPLFLLLGNGVAIYFVAVGYAKAWLVCWVIVLIALSFFAEKLLPYDRGFNQSQQDHGRDLLHALVNESLSVIGIWLLPLFGGLLTLAPLWPTDWPLVWQLVLAIMMADIGITLAHFASHRLQVLWRLHAVHHSVKRLYGFNGLMKHPLHQLLETVAGTAPLLLIGVPQNVLALLVVAVTIQLLLQHSNVAYCSGPLKKFLAINVVHRFHHLNSAEEGDVNFGLFTTLTDRILGTAHVDSARVITIRNLGIAAEPLYPSRYFQQLIQPFRRYQK